jgi:hypothetical protein
MSRRKSLTHNKKVIICTPEPTEWRFWDYKENGNNQIEIWYDGLSEDAQNMFDSLLKSNRKVKNVVHWIGFRKFLKGILEGSKIWELGFYSAVQHRVLAYCGPERMQATLLIGCFHKQGVYDPPDTFATALKRKSKLITGVGEHHERTIKTDR